MSRRRVQPRKKVTGRKARRRVPPHTFETGCRECGAVTIHPRVGDDLLDPEPIVHQPGCALAASIQAIVKMLGYTEESVEIVGRFVEPHLVFQVTTREPGREPVTRIIDRRGVEHVNG